MSELVRLTTGGRIYQGWTSISITRSIEAISGRFSLGLTDRWQGQDTPWPILPGAECTVKIGDDTVISGRVDSIAPRFDANSHTNSASGRDRTGQMVDCSAVHSPGEWANIRLERIAAILAEPFGISVKTEVDTGAPIQLVKIQPGETSFETLDRHCRFCGVLPVSDGQGGLILTRPGKTRCSTALIQGQNVKSASLIDDVSDRFHTYRVRGSQPGSDFLTPEQAAAVEGTAIDAGEPVGRTLIVLPEGSVDIARAKKTRTMGGNRQSRTRRVSTGDSPRLATG
jgi:prophage tail gpP-like protein